VETPAQQAHTTLPSARTTTGVARRFVNDTLRSWLFADDAVDAACLLTTELVTNSVIHAGGNVGVTLSKWDHVVRVEVTDESDVLPKAGPADLHLGLNGRGLVLVQGLASTWGVTPRDAGKSVWFELSTAESSAAHGQP